MATFTEAERLKARAAFNILNGNERNPISITKAELAAAVAALDSYFDANVTAINNSIPLPARTALSARQKALLVTAVIRKRYGV